jgi:S1-C subfamily serine protease
LFGRAENCLVALVTVLAGTVGIAYAQPSKIPAETVFWTAAPLDVDKAGRIMLTLHGTVVPGWHVYSLKQEPEGPTPLVVNIPANGVATADGAPAGSPPTKIHDPAFNLETGFYASAFTLTVPVRFKPHVKGQQAIPIDVRFQTCNGRVCEPPKTVRLSAQVTLQAGK